MPFVKITPRPFVDITKWKVGESYTGTLKSIKSVTRKYGECTVYCFERTPAAHSVNDTNIYGFYNLDCQMENVNIGEITKITYLGKKDNEHQVSVEVYEAKFK